MTAGDVRALVARHVEVTGDDAPLAMDSLTLVALVEELEAAADIRVRPSDLLPENFGTVAAIAAFVDRRTGEKGGSR